MSHEQSIWQRAKAIVGEASDLPPAQRDSFVEARCAGDTILRCEVESLLAAAESSEALLHPDADAWVGATRDTAPLPAVGRLGPFEVRRLIAQGPSSAVYEAHQAGPDRTVALKVLRSLPMLGPDPRFWLEAAAAARVEHPNVVRVYEVGVLDAGTAQRLPFIAMELIDGVPITRHAKDHALGIGQIVALVRKVCAGVARIHQCGIIHRDLKPANVLVDRAGEPRVLDFGIARLTSAPERTWHTHEGAMLGTPGYISPEQVRDPSGVDIRADVWALGVLTYELLAGRGPFDAASASALEAIRRVVEDEPVPLRGVAPRVPIDLEAVVMRALARRPEDRYASATDLADDLERAQSHRPVRARRATPLYRATRFVRRRAVPLSVASAIIGLGLTLGAGQVLAWRDAARQRDRATAALSLMRGMISSADPNFGHRDTLLRDVLASMETRLADTSDPLIEAEARSLLGSMSFGLGEYERSLALLDRAIALREASGQGRSPEAILDHAARAQALRWLYRPDDALASAMHARDNALALLAPDHHATLTAREVVAGCWQDLGRLDDAEREYRAVIERRRRLAPPHDRDTLIARSGLASVLVGMGRYADAERELAAISDLWQRHEGSLESIVARANLAQAIAEQGRLDEAVTLLRRVEADATAALGPTHPTALTARTNRIEFVRRQGHEHEALELGAEMVATCRAALGWSHDLTLTAVTGHVASLIRAGRAAEAADLARSARDACRDVLPPDHPRRARLDTSLAAALAADGRHDEALTIYRDSIARLEHALGPTHRQTLVARNNMSLAMLDAGRAGDAAEDLRAVLDAARAAGYAEMESVVTRNFGRALLASGDHAEGVSTLQRAFDLSVTRQETQNAATCARLLADHFERLGDQPAATRWRAREADPTAADPR